MVSLAALGWANAQHKTAMKGLNEGMDSSGDGIEKSAAVIYLTGQEIACFVLLGFALIRIDQSFSALVYNRIASKVWPESLKTCGIVPTSC